jgi:hypothetical protein
MASLTFQALLTRWDVLNSNLKPHLQAIPELEPGQKQFETMISEGLGLAAQQSQLTASLRDLIFRRNDLTKRGTCASTWWPACGISSGRTARNCSSSRSGRESGGASRPRIPGCLPARWLLPPDPGSPAHSREKRARFSREVCGLNPCTESVKKLLDKQRSGTKRSKD